MSNSPPQPPSTPPPELPQIDPTTFDLIVIGTSLPSSILSAAASSTAKSVLHLDPNPFYGSLFSSLSPLTLSSSYFSSADISVKEDISAIPLLTRSLISAVDFPPLPPDIEPLAHKIALDLSGPRVLFCADSAIELLIRSGVSQYLEFKGIDGSLIYDGETGRLISVPDSRAAIFKYKGLSPTEKYTLGKFFKLVEKHLSGDELVTEDDLEMPFVEFLSKRDLTKKIIGIILYAIAFSDYDQEIIEADNNLLKTKDGIKRLALYHSSIGRFPNAQGAMLYPMYGQGELPQAFCRRAAVKGCIYVLRMAVEALLADEATGVYKGVRLASGQEIFSQKLIMDPDFVVPQTLVSSTPAYSIQNCSTDMKKKVARAICITKSSLKPDASNLLIVLPPRSLYSEQATSVRALQISSNTGVCSAGMFVVHLSTLCNNASQGETSLAAAIEALFRQPSSGTSNDDSAENPLNHSDAPNAVEEEQRPVCEWRTLYIQEIAEGSVHTISTSPSPDGNLGYNDLFDAADKMFHQMFPGEVFFTEQASCEDSETEYVDPEL